MQLSQACAGTPGLQAFSAFLRFVVSEHRFQQPVEHQNGAPLSCCAAKSCHTLDPSGRCCRTVSQLSRVMTAQCMHQASAQQLRCERQSAISFKGLTAPLRQQRQRCRLQQNLSARAEVDVSQQEGAVEKTGPNFKPVKDVQEIMDILPHR